VWVISNGSRGLATTPNGIEFQGKIITCGAFPIGIDPEKFKEGLKKEKVQKRIATLEHKFQGVKLMVGVDRLDYIKGVPQKLHALEVFLSDHPEWVGKVVLVQVAVPSRQDVEEYQNLRAVVNELVGRINGKFGKYRLGSEITQWLIEQARSNSNLSTSCISPSTSTNLLLSTPYQMPVLSRLLATA
jgi:trehalose-6-phosphate synthase